MSVDREAVQPPRLAGPEGQTGLLLLRSMRPGTPPGPLSTDDDDAGADGRAHRRRPRHRSSKTPEQRAVLERWYQACVRPRGSLLSEIALDVGLPLTDTARWFRNRRHRPLPLPPAPAPDVARSDADAWVQAGATGWRLLEGHFQHTLLAAAAAPSPLRAEQVHGLARLGFDPRALDPTMLAGLAALFDAHREYLVALAVRSDLVRLPPGPADAQDAPLALPVPRTREADMLAGTHDAPDTLYPYMTPHGRLGLASTTAAAAMAAAATQAVGPPALLPPAFVLRSMTDLPAASALLAASLPTSAGP
jgi:hypothetical protein